MSVQIDDLETELKHWKDEYSTLESILEKKEEEYKEIKRMQEEEVALRLKFESKMNNIHAIHRSTEAIYQRSLLEIDEPTQRNIALLDDNKKK